MTVSRWKKQEPKVERAEQAEESVHKVCLKYSKEWRTINHKEENNNKKKDYKDL